MACEACRASFDAAETMRDERAVFLDASHPLCACEANPASELSPGAIDASETLVRILVTPVHASRDGRVKGAAFSRAETTGLSLVRDAHASDEEIFRVAEALVAGARTANGNRAGVIGVLLIRKSEIKEVICEVDNFPAYCLYDTALLDNKGHAEAFQRVDSAPLELKTLRRAALHKRVERSFVKPEDFRKGLLVPLAPSG